MLAHLQPGQRAELADLIARASRAIGHPALPEPQRMAVAEEDLGGGQAKVATITRGGRLVACAVIFTSPDGSVALHAVVDPDQPGEGGAAALRRSVLRGALAALPVVTPAPTVRLWAMRATETDDRDATELGFRPERELLQLRVPLPLADEVVAAARPVATRPFVIGQDEDVWLSINNRAFDGHPEQGGWTRADLDERLGAPWVDLDGFLMGETPDGSVIGSCWTKVHRDADPVLGEIYVVAVDPARHGEGWGRALTVAGLGWMAQHGSTLGMLYTGAENAAAVALYRSLGFTTDHTDRAYVR